MGVIVATMVTKRMRRRLFLKEHREAKGISALTMGERLGIERESVYRLEREQWRMTTDKQAEYAFVLGIEPQELWYRPGQSVLDGMSPAELQEMAADIVRRLVAGQQ